MKTVWSKGKLKQYNTRLMFQAEFERADEIRLVALDFYRIFINEKFLGYGPAKTAVGYARIDRYNLSEYRNFVITVEVLCYNIPNYSVASQHPLFGAEVLKEGNVFATTADFAAYTVGDYVRKTQKYSFQRGFSENYVMERDRKSFYLGENFFEREEVCEVQSPVLLPRGVDYPVYTTIESKCIEYGTVLRNTSLPHWYESWQMENNPRLNFCFDRSEIEEFVSDTVSELVYSKSDSTGDCISANEYLAYDFSQIEVGFFSFCAEVAEDCEIYLVWAETADFGNGSCEITFSRNDCCDIIKFSLKKGKYSLQTFEPYAARYAKIICLKGSVRLNGLSIVSLENRKKDRFQFTCENKNLELILKASQNTLAHNAVDIFTDCPGRERAGWLCDSYFMGKAEFLLFGNNKTEKNFLENYALAANIEGYPEGMVPMCYPSDVASRKYIPNWALWLILELQDYYSRTSDRDLIDRMKGKVYGILEYFNRYKNQEGLLENLVSWVFVEWSKANDYTYGVNFPTNMLYTAALKAVGQMYNDPVLLMDAECNAKNIVAYSFNGNFFADNAVRSETGTLVRTNNFTETCQYYALFFDFAEGDGFNEFRQIMFDKFGRDRKEEEVYPEIAKSNAFIGNYLRLAYLLRAGMYKEVLSESEKYFLYMAQQTCTLWEHNTEAKSLDHGFAAYAACLIIESLRNSKEYAYEINYRDE